MDPALQTARYINLTTFRKDGREVATPVWCAMANGKLCFYTVANSGKVKRIRATQRVKVAPSDGRGKPLGAWSEGTARILTDPAEAARVYRAMAAKYGWQYALITLFARITGNVGRRITVELTL
jgi:hypothetical protein